MKRKELFLIYNYIMFYVGRTLIIMLHHVTDVHDLVNSHNCKLIVYSLRRNLATLASCSDVMSSQVESQNCGFLRNNECRLIVCCIRFLDSLLGNLKATGICFKVRYVRYTVLLYANIYNYLIIHNRTRIS